MEPSAHFERKQALFEEALDLPPEARKAFLERACADDEALRNEMEDLLRAREKGSLPPNPLLVRMVEEPVHTPMLSEGTVLENRYRITSELGKGGMGMVYLAQNIDPGLSAFRQVALKQALPDFRQVFDREIKILSAFSHPHVPKVIELIRVGDDRILVMEYIEGKNLKDLVKEQHAPLDLDTVLNWGVTLLKTLRALHTFNPYKKPTGPFPEVLPETEAQKRGHQRPKKRPAVTPPVSSGSADPTAPRPVLHQDIKPANVMLSNDGNLYLMDFGLARSGALHLTTLHDIKGGTRAYASPEQFDDTRPVTVQSDIYGLGATLFHLLTGLPPMAAPDREEALLKGQGDPVATALVAWQRVAKGRRLRRDISAWLLKAMALDPAHRWASAEAMQAALHEVRERENKRYPVPLLAVISTLLVLVAFFGYREYQQWAVANAPPVLPEQVFTDGADAEPVEVQENPGDTTLVATDALPEGQESRGATSEDIASVPAEAVAEDTEAISDELQEVPPPSPADSGVTDIEPVVTQVMASFSFSDGQTGGAILIDGERIGQRIGVSLATGEHRMSARRAGQVLEKVEVDFILNGTPDHHVFPSEGGEAVVHLEPGMEDIKIKIYMSPSP